MPNGELNPRYMQAVTRELSNILSEYSPKFAAITNEVFSEKPLPHKWSKKEVLGHLIDSAQNNLRRFICAQYESHPPFITYQQDFWVESNQYQSMEKADVIHLWRLINERIIAVLNNMAPEAYDKQANTGTLHSLEWLAQDYVKHLKHHVNQIIPRSFNIIYP